MNLIVDIGNTAVKIAVIDNEEIVLRRVEERLTEAVLDEVFGCSPLIDKAIVSSTGAGGDSAFAMVGPRVGYALRMTPLTPLPIGNAYASPETLGTDRLAAAVGAQALYGGGNMLIVDFGTAITVDLVAGGKFLGGNISPGAGLRFRALHEHTAVLPLCRPTDETMDYGNTTRTAVEQGVMTGIVNEIEGYIAEFGKKYADLCIIFTGGDAIFFVKRIKNTIFANPDLIFFGLNEILKHNAKTSDIY